MDEPQYLALIRHGKTLANVEIEKATSALYYAITGSDKTVGLTSQGELDCLRAGRILAKVFPPTFQLKRIWQSEFLRVWQSTDTICGCFPYPIERLVDKRFNKRSYGVFWNLSYEGVRVLHPGEDEIFRRLGVLKYRPPGGENYFDLFERVDEVAETEINNFEGNQAVVGHSAVILAMRRRLEGLSDLEVVRQYEMLSIPNGYVILYRRESRSSPWKRVHIADLIFGDELRV